jgi:hypothetical protein
VRTTLRMDVDWQESPRSRWPWRSVWTADGKELGRIHYDRNGYFFAVVGNARPSKRTQRLWEAIDRFKRAIPAAPEVETPQTMEPISETIGDSCDDSHRETSCDDVRTENKVAPAP